MRLSSECISCVLGSAMEIMAKQFPESRHKELAKSMLATASRQNWQESPPEFARKLYTFLQQSGGKADSFAREKELSTVLAGELLPEMRRIINSSSNRFGNLVKAVIGGNIIDCGADRAINIASAITELKKVFSMPLDEALISDFEKQFHRAGSIFYMLDNCGEAVFDRLLLEEFSGRITLGVRGGFILNDITLNEVAASGLSDYCCVDTGDATPGVVLKRCKAEFIQAMQSADLVIAKGQGNFETLDLYDRPIVHLLRVKCPAVARVLNKKRGDLALVMRNTAN